MKINLLTIICFVVLCTILALGLWPFHSPTNDVTWLRTRDGLRFGKHGTVFGSSSFKMASSPGDTLIGSVEIWLQPARISGGGTLLAFCAARTPFRFSLAQSIEDLLVQGAIQREQNHTKAAKFYVGDVFRRTGPAFITVTSGTRGLAVYIDGVLAVAASQFRLPADQFTGRLVLGDSPGQEDSWKGQLLGFAIYNQELTQSQLLRHYKTWTQTGRPELATDDGNVALYLFDEHAGNVVHNHVNSGVDLSIPKKYVVLDQIFLEPFWKEFSMSRNYWGAAFKNIVGFIPFGFCFYARLSLARWVKRALLATVLLGFLVSLTIEVLQAYLPTRDSGMTDLVTNTLGTLIGVLICRSLVIAWRSGKREQVKA